MHVAVIGAHGQLGAAIVHEFSGPHEVTALARGDLDLTDDRAVTLVMSRLRPDLIVNCAAYNDVDGAEDHPVEALNVNALAVRALARAAAEHAVPLVHYSTDFVFDGTASAPYVEDDRPNPRSIYAASKLLGEWFAADASPWYVLRVESLFGRAPGAPPGRKTVAAIVDKLVKGEAVKVFQDRTVTPTYVIDAAQATRQLVERGAASGLYHCVNSGSCTWLEMASELASQLGVQPRLVPMRMADVRFRAARPLYCALSNAKLRAAGIEMPAWQDAVQRFLAAEGNGVRS
jgi:dTDP-4-dehydrorhamnose reductase